MTLPGEISSCSEVLKKLHQAGMLPGNVSRVVIDINLNKPPVKVFYETSAEKEMMDVCIESIIKNKENFLVKEVR